MTQLPLILSFDTATPCCSVALTRGEVVAGQVIASLALNAGITHSRRLLGSIEWLLQESALGWDDISAVAVGLGPGSFTGLRIGLATAKGLCHGTGKPLLGVSSLDAIGASVRSQKLICAVLDARKKQVYSCFYRCDAAGIARPCGEAAVLSPETLAGRIGEPVVMAGDGVDAYRAFWTERLGAGLEIAAARHRFPAAELIGFLAAERYRAGELLELAGAAPLYVRVSDAELSLVAPADNRAEPGR